MNLISEVSSNGFKVFNSCLAQPWILLVSMQKPCKCPGSSSRTVMDLIQLFDIKEIYSWITRRILLNFGPIKRASHLCVTRERPQANPRWWMSSFIPFILKHPSLPLSSRWSGRGTKYQRQFFRYDFAVVALFVSGRTSATHMQQPI